MKGKIKSDFILYLKEDLVESVIEFRKDDVVNILKVINHDVYGVIYVVFNPNTCDSITLHSIYVDLIEEDNKCKNDDSKEIELIAKDLKLETTDDEELIFGKEMVLSFSDVKIDEGFLNGMLKQNDEFITGENSNQTVIDKGDTVTKWKYNDLDCSTSILTHNKQNILTRFELIKESKFDYMKHVVELKEDNNRYVDFYVNRQKRVVTAVIYELKDEKKKQTVRKGIARCMEEDIFNKNIGMAIALRKALKKHIPSWLRNSSNDVKFDAGAKVINKKDNTKSTVLSSIDEKNILCDYTFFNLPRRKDNLKVIDDSEVNYFNIINIREV